jgi:hypothetical protein
LPQPPIMDEFWQDLIFTHRCAEVPDRNDYAINRALSARFEFGETPQ